MRPAADGLASVVVRSDGALARGITNPSHGAAKTDRGAATNSSHGERGASPIAGAPHETRPVAERVQSNDSRTSSGHATDAPHERHLMKQELVGDDQESLSPAVVVSSWVLFALLGDEAVMELHTRQRLETGVRDAVADAIEVCRTSVTVADLRAHRLQFVVDPLDGPRHGSHASLLHRLRQLVRKARGQPVRRVNMTRVTVVYEIRILDKLRTNDTEVVRKVDGLQSYSKFGDLGRLLMRYLVDSTFRGVVLDDLGYATRRTVHRQPMPHDRIDDCIEEGMLHDARKTHQLVLVVSSILMVLTACAGSAVFTIKHPSIVPSRMNPLLRAGGEDS